MITHSAKETGEDGGVRQNLKNRMGGGGGYQFRRRLQKTGEVKNLLPNMDLYIFIFF